MTLSRGIFTDILIYDIENTLDNILLYTYMY